LFIYLLTRNGSKFEKDLRVFRVGPRESLNTLFLFFPLFLISQILAMVRKNGGTSKLEEHNTMESCMLCLRKMNHS
ncbi:hypothetical protein V6Z11_A09G007600, partial [Gossypium hirsutum]